jgi:hypothetical protein
MAPHGIYQEINQDNRNNGARGEPIATQRLSEQVLAATNTQEITEVLLKTMFSVRSVQSGC